MLKLLLTNCLLWVACVGTVQAQERTVSGRVTSSADGSALPGATVTVKGTTRGSTADATGKYTISVPVSAKAALVFSSIAFATQEVDVGTRSVVDVELSEAIGTLSEIAVVGYGTQDRRTLTGAQASVKGADLAKATLPSVTDMLQGSGPTGRLYWSAGGEYANPNSGDWFDHGWCRPALRG